MAAMQIDMSVHQPASGPHRGPRFISILAVVSALDISRIQGGRQVKIGLPVTDEPSTQERLIARL